MTIVAATLRLVIMMALPLHVPLLLSRRELHAFFGALGARPLNSLAMIQIRLNLVMR